MNAPTKTAQPLPRWALWLLIGCFLTITIMGVKLARLEQPVIAAAVDVPEVTPPAAELPAENTEDAALEAAKFKLALILNYPTLNEAIAGIIPEMGDTQGGSINQGAAYLAIWGANFMKWEALQKVPAGSYAMVMKDSKAQRGKRLCVTGQVIEITIDPTPENKFYVGGLFDNKGKIYRFIAIGSTGELVAESKARFCGVITGQQHYPNSVGGVAHAVHLVGMFDLPENKNRL